ncbi:MAG: hypothetical protein K9G09_02850 [Pontimonas sp.]|nr:hypothetical protein [Pontimonas sp.]
MRRRFFAPLVLAAAVITGTTGCTLSAEIATMKEYDPSDGVGADIGDLALRNILLISNDAGEANLVMTVVNTSGDDVTLNVQFDDGSARITQSLELPAVPERTRIGDNPSAGVLVSGPELIVGGLYPVYFEYGNVPGELVFVPVLDGTLPEYELLVP